jgi:branched-chain amino acid transport system substrate-binding protein
MAGARRLAIVVTVLVSALLALVPVAHGRTLDGYVGSYGVLLAPQTSWTWGDATRTACSPAWAGGFCRKADVFAAASVAFTYGIDGSDFEFYGGAHLPAVGNNEVDCAIRRRGATTAVDNSPYRCSTSWRQAGDTENPQPLWMVTRKPTVTITDRAQQRAKLRAICGSDGTNGNCSYLPRTTKVDLHKPAVQAATPFMNCTEDPARRILEVTTGTRTETSLEVTVGIEAELAKWLKASLEVKVGHTWEQSTEKKEGAEIEVPPGKTGTFDYVATYDEVAGDVELVAPDAVYILPDAQYDFPPQSGDKGTLKARTGAADCGPGATRTVCVPADGGPDGAAGSSMCAGVSPARVRGDWCLTDGYDDGTCPPQAAFGDLSGAPPAGQPFVHWGSPVQGATAATSCPDEARPADGAVSGQRSGDGRAQAWTTCVDGRPAPAPTALAEADPVVAAPIGAGASSSPTAIAARRATRATVYVSLPLATRSGDAARDLAAAARLAFADHHSRAGGARLRLRVLSDADPRTGRWSPSRARANALLAARDRTAIGYIGDASSGATASALSVLNRAGILTVSPSSTAVELTTDRRFRPSGRRTFARVVPNDFHQANGLARSMRRAGVSRVFVVRDGEDFGRGLTQAFAAAAPHQGLRVVGRAGVPGRAAGRERLAARNARSCADGMLIAGLAQNGARPLLRAVAQAAPTVKLFGGDGLADDPAFLAGARDDGFEALLHLTSPAMLPDTLPASGQDVFRRVWSTTGRQPDAYAVYGYEAMNALLDSADRARVARRSLTGARRATVDAFFAIRNRRSPVGTYSITRHGDSSLVHYGEFTVRDGRIVAPVCVGDC